MNMQPKPGLEQYVVDMTQKGYRVVDIFQLQKSKGIKPVTKSRIIKIQQNFGLKQKNNKRGRPKRT